MTLYAIADAEPVLLCFEKPPFTEENWSHLVASWFKRELGETVDEIDR